MTAKGTRDGMGATRTLPETDFVDTTDEGALRVEGAAVVSYNTGTTQYSIEAGVGSVTSGSDNGIAFTTAFQMAPVVSHSLVWDGVAQATVGSMVGGLGSITSAGFNIVNAGSGAGFTYIACGQKA